MRYHHMLLGPPMLDNVGLCMVHMHNIIPDVFFVDSLLLMYNPISLI